MNPCQSDFETGLLKSKTRENGAGGLAIRVVLPGKDFEDWPVPPGWESFWLNNKTAMTMVITSTANRRR